VDIAEDNPEAKNETSWEGYDREELNPPVIADPSQRLKGVDSIESQRMTPAAFEEREI
jgi:hypothetical protein